MHSTHLSEEAVDKESRESEAQDAQWGSNSSVLLRREQEEQEVCDCR